MDFVTKSREISNEWKKYYIAMLPKYAWAYEEGDIYVRSHHMIEIERSIKDIYIKTLENMGTHNLPPNYNKSKEYLIYCEQSNIK